MTQTQITRKAAADRAEVQVRTVARWLADGKLTKHVDGRGRVWIDPDELDRLLTPVPASTN